MLRALGVLQVDAAEVREVPLAQSAALPALKRGQHVGQKAHGVVRRQDRQSDQIAEDHQHEQLVEFTAGMAGFDGPVADRQAVLEIAHGPADLGQTGFYLPQFSYAVFPSTS